MNKYKLVLTQNTDKEITLPIEIKWDFLGRSNDIDTYEERTVKEVLNSDKDFEVARFSHAVWGNNFTDINYEFNFLPADSNPDSVKNLIWDSDYVIQGFTLKELYYFSNSFKRSFFKLDFYDTPSQSGQTNYFTIILPTQQGLTRSAKIGTENVKVVTPVFKLDFLGDKEGFFIYWLKKREFINKNTFYMSAKFFDGKNGVFVRMMNTEQGKIGNNAFNFNIEKYFYYRVELDYKNFTYEVFDGNVRFGTEDNPIKWYEYLNPT